MDQKKNSAQTVKRKRSFLILKPKPETKFTDPGDVIVNRIAATSRSLKATKPLQKKKASIPEEKTDYIPFRRLEQAYINGNDSAFVLYLRSKFNHYHVENAIEMYFLCSHTDSSVIFWQIDTQERIRSGKVMHYSPETGKRIKDPNGRAAINWMHKQPFNLKQCLFGLHLLKEYPSKPVAIVESEKTAVIMSIKEPRFIWLACGSMNGFKTDMLSPVRLRKIIGFPDKGCFELWQKTAEMLNATGFNIIISDVLEKNTTLKEGDDLADLP